MHEVRMDQPYSCADHVLSTNMNAFWGERGVCVCGRGGTKHGLTRAAGGRVLLF